MITPSYMSTTLPIINGQIDWPAYHSRRAIEYRAMCESWHGTAQSLADSDPRMALFAVARANANELFAIEAKAKAKGGAI